VMMGKKDGVLGMCPSYSAGANVDQVARASLLSQRPGKKDLVWLEQSLTGSMSSKWALYFQVYPKSLPQSFPLTLMIFGR
jgi:hypothetical protein